MASGGTPYGFGAMSSQRYHNHSSLGLLIITWSTASRLCPGLINHDTHDFLYSCVGISLRRQTYFQQFMPLVVYSATFSNPQKCRCLLSYVAACMHRRSGRFLTPKSAASAFGSKKLAAYSLIAERLSPSMPASAQCDCKPFPLAKVFPAHFLNLPAPYPILLHHPVPLLAISTHHPYNEVLQQAQPRQTMPRPLLAPTRFY